MNSHKNLGITFIMVILAAFSLGFVGCSSGENNPMGNDGNDSPTDPPAPVIKTPVGLKVTSITVEDFGTKDGGNWDFDAFWEHNRRPDIYVTFQSSPNADPWFVSVTDDNAWPDLPYKFDKAKKNGGALPKQVTATGTHYVYLMDDDGLVDDDMGYLSFKPINYYNDDNATGFRRKMSGTNGSKFTIAGTWVY